MQKVILDTNVIVSALISPGIPSKILSELILKEKIKLLLSNDIFSEYVNVLLRPKFRKIPNFLINAEVVLSRIEELAKYYKPSKKIY